MNRDYPSKVTLLFLVFLISALFLAMTSHFLMPVFLAGIFAALAQPLYQGLSRLSGGRRKPAALITILLIIFTVLIPSGILVGLITSQAIKVGESVTPWVQQKLAEPDMLSELMRHIPFYERIVPYRALILEKAGEMVGMASSYLIDSLSSITVMTVNFLFAVLILLYSMFFFLMDGDKLLARLLYYLPLENKDESLLLDKFTSVTRATMKGTLVVGLVQGVLAGVAFWVAGISSPAFWGAIMAVLSIIPGIGAALIWVPASIILMAGGMLVQGVALAVFCALVVGGIDNFLRPVLVGKDTKMHELMIFFSTLGGLALFGFIGIIIGPLIAALFITIWEIYGVAFKDVLPQPGGRFKHILNGYHDRCDPPDQTEITSRAGEKERATDAEIPLPPTRKKKSPAGKGAKPWKA
ncbi:MAG: AI-2E family transporter [Deltaproteobacteria bacterium]|nr:AI-2E family transporter [Deltaproteobacteria bacterium]